MWNDEDNNPYAFERRDSGSDDALSPDEHRYPQPTTPPSGQPSPIQAPAQLSSESQHSVHDDHHDEAPITRKKGGYDSRVEQILYERPDLVISITTAGKNVEGGGNFIVYTIRTGDVEVRRRYSDFYSLRKTLVDLHPTLIVPPIPEKHSMADYAAKPTKAKEDEAIIDHRKRMLTSFLNRCRKMRNIREDGVFWRFLDPNASWSEVLHSHPVSSLPKSNLKAPPLDPANPTPGHNFLPIPSTSAKLKSARDVSSSGTPQSPSLHATIPSASAHATSGPQIFGKFPPPSANLSETDLDPYFVNFETSSKELETLLQGGMDKVNKRMISHFNSYSEDLAELGARFNGFSLNEQSSTLATAIEKIGQAVDSTYIATGELSSQLSAGFSEPMRESSQFASIVRNVLRFRILKRVQEEMTKDELEKKRMLLDQLERSEMESQRLGSHLERSGYLANPGPPRQSSSARNSTEQARSEDDRASIDSDFPTQRQPDFGSASETGSSPTRRKSSSNNLITSKIFGRLSHAFQGMADVDPERTRRDQIGKTKESLDQLQQALQVSGKDVKDASSGVMSSLQEYQTEKEEDLRRYMIAFARCHIEWAKRNLGSWEEARQEVNNIDMR